jgi:hypothetical protein
VVSRVVIFALAVFALAQIGAGSAAGDSELQSPTYYLGRADPRLCPSPVCGGLWLTPVNGARPSCRDPAGRACYVTRLAFRESEVSEARRQRLTQLVAEGRALVLGHLGRANVAGFPDLQALRVVDVWQPASSRRPSGVFRMLRDNGVRCVTQPCFSIQATALNVPRGSTISEVDLGRTGATAAERRRALARISTRQLVAAGEIVRKPNAGPAGAGRVFVATQIYFPVRPS